MEATFSACQLPSSSNAPFYELKAKLSVTTGRPIVFSMIVELLTSRPASNSRHVRPAGYNLDFNIGIVASPGHSSVLIPRNFETLLSLKNRTNSH